MDELESHAEQSLSEGEEKTVNDLLYAGQRPKAKKLVSLVGSVGRLVRDLGTMMEESDLRGGCNTRRSL